MKRLFALIAAFALLLAAPAALAQVGAPDPSFAEQAGLSAIEDPRIAVVNIIRLAFGFLGIIATLIVLYAGFTWMTAGGDVERIDRAKKTLTAGVIGLIITLSAFGIASFIINRLSEAVGAANQGITGPGGAGGGGGFGSGGAGGPFRPTAIQPSGDLGKRDVVVSVTFSAAPTRDPSNINANVVLEQDFGAAGRQAVAYDVESVNNTIKLRSKNACPEPNGDKRCLEPDAQYWVTIRGGLRSAGGTQTVSCGISAACSASFRTGAAIGTEPPTVVITSPSDGQSVPADSIVQIQTRVGDEFGAAAVEYSAAGSYIGTDGAIQSVAPNAWTSAYNWDTASFDPVRTVTLGATAFNVDDDSAESNIVRVTVRAPHCFNGVRDFDEAGPDCGGADCGFCGSSSCSSNAECSSGECEGGVCVENPRIVDVQLRDGRPGNFVTILGSRFGSSAGTVSFMGSGTPVAAEVASCAGAWSPTQIVVVVPEGAEDGPISVTTASGRSDATDDASGPIIPDFDVNNTARPGICAVDPRAAKVRDSLTVSGGGFGAAQAVSAVEFLPADASCALIQGGFPIDAGAVPSWTDTELRPMVPNLPTGSSGLNYLVRARVGGEPSNPACVLALPPEAGTEPAIELVSPDRGSSGTYVTLRGANFGSGGKVEFTSGAGTAVGDVQFPLQCGGDFWSDGNVTVKVPETYVAPSGTPIARDEHQVKLIRADGRESNAVAFTVNDDPLRPGICRIEPDNGPPGSPVTIYGDGFGTTATGDIPAALSAHPDVVGFFENVSASFIGLWRDNEISAAVPQGAETGPVVFRRYTGTAASVSNGVTYTVRDCRQAADACGAGQSCCGDGSCRPDGACAESKAGGFAWQFSTGRIPRFPVVVENSSCQLSVPSVMPSPNPYKGSTGVCADVSQVTAAFSLPMDPTTLTSSSVFFETCGAGERAADCAPVSPPPSIDLIGQGSGDAMIPDSLLVLGVRGSIQPSTWYRLRITGGARSADEPTRASQPLDGDFDGQGGGEYLSTFRTGTEDCELSGVDIQPDPGLIASASERLTMKAFPLSERCIILSCENRSVGWTSSDLSKATVSPAGGSGQCETSITPVAETAPGPNITVRATIDGRADQAGLKIDYANPTVEVYGPRDCDIACVNTVPFARFNTDMKTAGAGSIYASMRLKRCKNESCLSFDPALDVPATVTYTEETRTAYLKPTVNLDPDTFYRVLVDGTARSTSDAPLSGLNYDASAFSWIFRTRTDGNACGIQAVSIEPPATVLRYIGEIGKVEAIPRTSPDACAADGQVLNSATIDWTWSELQTPANPDAFTIAPYHPRTPPPTLRVSADLAPRCTAQCLYAGSFPVGTARCGNGLIEKGEECEGPGQNGCSDRCLRTGSSASTCGDGIIQSNLGEACDEGAQNGQPDSGCASDCRLTGSVPGVSMCGNRSIGVGESCDDGNRSSGDGCSAECLLEGSAQNVSVCGNGALEDGEQCDWLPGGPATASALLTRGGTVAFVDGDVRDPNRGDFACGQSCLLRGTSGPTCGDGIIDYAKGESCDAGEQNGRPGSGCSRTCTKTGSDPELRAFCGDSVVTVAAGGGGEDCEALGGTTGESSTQYVTALNRCNASEPICRGNVFASANGVRNDDTQGTVTVECSCRQDSDCAAFGNLACGAGACCYPRPEPPTIEPVGGNACRNAMVTVTFAESMSDGTLAGNLFVVEDQAGCTPPGLAASETRGFLAGVRKFVLGIFGRQVSAADCPAVRGAFSHERVVRADGSSFTVSTFRPEQPYAPNRGYRVVVRGGANGVKSANGAGYASNPAATQTFSTAADICKLDAVEVSPSRELIQSSDRVAGFTARAVTVRNGLSEPISPLPGYAWTLDWNLVPGASLSFQPEPTGYAASVQAAAGQNGEEQLVAAAQMTENTVLPSETPVGSEIAGKADITIMLCENPWPARDTSTGAWAPYVDPETHFSFFYCRDGASGLLPNLKPIQPGIHPVAGQAPATPDMLRFCRAAKDGGDQPKSCQTNADCGGGDVCAAKDLFFQFDDARIRDAIGVRVMSNERHLSPSDWYLGQQLEGSPAPIEVDGYSALKDPATLYVSAPDKYGDPEFRSYVYVFGLGSTADARVTDVFNRLTGNLLFNANIASPQAVTGVCKSGTVIERQDGDMVSCSSNLDCQKALPEKSATVFCDAPKDKLRRDARRWEQLLQMTSDLEETRDRTGFFPRAESGSFIRGLTVSKWPSWTTLLGQAGTQVDPINEFNQCEKFGSICAATGTSCVSSADCENVPNNACRPRFEAETCFDNRNAVFMCPKDSQVYIYRAVGGVDYRLNAEFESDPSIPWTGGCRTAANELFCLSRSECSWDAAASRCADRIDIARDCRGVVGSVQGASLYGGGVEAVCGNGIRETGEECEIGETEPFACVNGVITRSCSLSCRWEPAAPNCASLPAAQCGNGSVEASAGETCDDGAQNGEYNRCRSVGTYACRKACVRTDTSPFSSTKPSGSCVTNADCGEGHVCTDRMSFCGDGVRNGNEACDDGALNGQYGRCSWDCRGPGPYCGDNVVNPERSPVPERCDGNRETTAGICWPQDPGTGTLSPSTMPEHERGCTTDADCSGGWSCFTCPASGDGLPQNRSRACNPASAGADACTFAGWSACQPSGSCGNGIVEGTEECDQGSANADGGECLTSCKLNRCGDGKLRTGVEQCDTGSSNGVLCVPGYGSTCNYCKQDCTVETVSGTYCGDGTVTSPETCDNGPKTGWCSRTPSKACGPGNDLCAPGFCRKYTDGGAGAGTSSGPSCVTLDFDSYRCTCPAGQTITPPECGTNCNSFQRDAATCVGGSASSGASFAYEEPKPDWKQVAAFAVERLGSGFSGLPYPAALADIAFRPFMPRTIATLAAVVWTNHGGSYSGFYNPDTPTPMSHYGSGFNHVITRIEYRVVSKMTGQAWPLTSCTPNATSFSCQNQIPPLPVGDYYDINVTMTFADGEPPYQHVMFPNQRSVKCGDGQCMSPEHYAVCPADCTAPPPPQSVCGNAVVESGENCDAGSQNGVACTAAYGGTCSYCSSSCVQVAVQGGFCGDAVCQASEDDRSCAQDCAMSFGGTSGGGSGSSGPTFGGNPVVFALGPVTTKRCWTSNECGADEFCEGGDGECIGYGSLCTPSTYSNIHASPAVDGSCQTCSTSCVAGTQTSPKFCGDSLVQPEFGERCDGNGDLFATGAGGSRYECAQSCQFTGNAYCGNGEREGQFGEIADHGASTGASSLTSGAIRGRVKDAIDVGPVSGVTVELWQGKTKLDEKTTNANGEYAFTGLTSPNTCKAAYHIRIPAAASGVGGPRKYQFKDEQGNDRVHLGYQAMKIPQESGDTFTFRSPVDAPETHLKTVVGQIAELQDIRLVPRLVENEYLAVVSWTGNLQNGEYLDFHLKTPGDLPGRTDGSSNENGTYYQNPGNANLEIGRHSKLYCYHEGGSNESCGSFTTAPETMHFKFRSTAGSREYFWDRQYEGETFVGWLVDWACGGASNTNTKTNCSNFNKYDATVSVYGAAGLARDKDDGREAVFQIPAAGQGGYWQLFTVSRTGAFDIINTLASQRSW